MPDVVEKIHGTYRMYAKMKCRCDECREYQNSRVARNRAERLRTGNLSHGKRSAYDAGCRCGQCTGKRLDIYFKERSKARGRW